MSIKFGSPVTGDDTVYLDGVLIKWCDKVKHLGNTVHSSLSDSEDCVLKCHVLIVLSTN